MWLEEIAFYLMAYKAIDDNASSMVIPQECILPFTIIVGIATVYTLWEIRKIK